MSIPRRIYRSAVRPALASAGYELRRIEPARPAEPEPLRALVRSQQPVILDVGAETGRTVANYRKVFPSARIFAFEPTPARVVELRERFAADALVTVVAAAVGASGGSAVLHVNRFEQTNSLLPTDDAGASFWGSDVLETDREVEVRVVALDDFCREQGVDRVDVLKIDVQGAEMEVLEGARTLLERHAVSVVEFEVIVVPTYEGQHPLHEYLALMDELGYVLSSLFEPVTYELRLLQLVARFFAPEALPLQPRNA